MIEGSHETKKFHNVNAMRQNCSIDCLGDDNQSIKIFRANEAGYLQLRKRLEMIEWRSLLCFNCYIWFLLGRLKFTCTQFNFNSSVLNVLLKNKSQIKVRVLKLIFFSYRNLAVY